MSKYRHTFFILQKKHYLCNVYETRADTHHSSCRGIAPDHRLPLAQACLQAYTRPSAKFPSAEISHEEENIRASARDIIEESRTWLGTPYCYGGQSRKGTDCSGMVMKVFEAKGIKLPRDSRSQQAWCLPIDKTSLKPADLVFFASSAGGSRVSHVGIFIGKSQFIHSSTSKGVIVSSLDEDYYIRHFHSAGRVPQVNGDVSKNEKKKIEASQKKMEKLLKESKKDKKKNDKNKKKSKKKKKTKK